MSETPTQHPLKLKVRISRFDRFLHLFFLWHSGALKSHTSSLMKTWKPWRLWGLMQDDAMCFKVLRDHGITSLSIWVSWNYPRIRITLDSWHNTVFEPGEVWIASEKLWRACGNKQTRENLCRSSMVKKIEPVVVSSHSFAEALCRLEMFTVSRSCIIYVYIHIYIYNIYIYISISSYPLQDLKIKTGTYWQQKSGLGLGTMPSIQVLSGQSQFPHIPSWSQEHLFLQDRCYLKFQCQFPMLLWEKKHIDRWVLNWIHPTIACGFWNYTRSATEIIRAVLGRWWRYILCLVGPS